MIDFLKMRIKFGNKILGMLAMIGLSLSFVACSNENGADDSQPVNPPTLIGENLIVCNEGNWQSDNGQLSYYDGTAGVLTNKWFRLGTSRLTNLLISTIEGKEVKYF